LAIFLILTLVALYFLHRLKVYGLPSFKAVFV